MEDLESVQKWHGRRYQAIAEFDINLFLCFHNWYMSRDGKIKYIGSGQIAKIDGEKKNNILILLSQKYIM